MDNLITFLKLIFPIFLGLYFLSLIFCMHINPKEPLTVRVALPFFISIDMPTKYIWPLRLIILFVSITCFLFPAFRDYSPLFPSHLKMQVFFDDEGIIESLKNYDSTEMKTIKIKDNWQNDKFEYISNLNNHLKNKIGTNFIFDGKENKCISEGETTFIVIKNSKWGLQRYTIQEAHGSLSHCFRGESTNLYFPSKFYIRKTNRNNISLGFYDIYFGYTVTIYPEFDQKFTLTTGEDIYHHHLTALTKIRFFPYIDISNTIYLLKLENSEYVPIGYAIYNFD